MNERIKELREQAFDWVQYQLCTVGSDHPVMQNEQLAMINQKFAELIVRECIQQARSVGDLRGVNDDMIYGADYAALQISKHFGVEEIEDSACPLCGEDGSTTCGMEGCQY